MKTTALILTLGSALAMSSTGAENESATKPTAAEKAFIHKAANGGMTEVELGQIAEKNGTRDDVKSFGERMVKDHGKANDDLKSVASKLNVNVPDKVNAKHQATIDKFSKMSGDSFDAAYAKEMVRDHKEDIAEFEKAQGEVKNEDLKKFITDTIPVMKEHLQMAEKMEGAK
jgi:putative membrane protein